MDIPEPPITLTEAELLEITGYKLPSKQRLYFVRLGVPAEPRADGSLCVIRAHLLNYRPHAENDEPKVRTVRKVA